MLTLVITEPVSEFLRELWAMAANALADVWRFRQNFAMINYREIVYHAVFTKVRHIVQLYISVITSLLNCVLPTHANGKVSCFGNVGVEHVGPTFYLVQFMKKQLKQRTHYIVTWAAGFSSCITILSSRPDLCMYV